MNKGKRKGGIIWQVAALFLVGILTTGLLSYFSERALSGVTVQNQMETIAARLADETMLSIKEYPAYEWLIRYWYAHTDEMDIEYDAEFGENTRTEEKCRRLNERYPDLQLKYVSEQQLQSLPQEDQKLYAEIVYSWLITRVNQIKKSNHIDYLFCVLTDESYATQVFLFSAAEPGAVRGTSYEEAYPLGTTVTVNESQQEAMRQARQNDAHLADAGEYVDYYAFMDMLDERPILIGMTYNLSVLRANVDAQTRRSTRLAMANQITLSVICLLLVFQFVLRPLRKIQHNIRLYQETKDSEAVAANLAGIRSRNEIGQLSEDVTALAKEIDDYMHSISSITAERERISTELSLAMRIQTGMLPNIFPAFPDQTAFDIYALMEPAKEVGGDFYDFFLVDDDHLCLVMADVSGKGVPAALFMMASKIMIANYAKFGQSPAEILETTNSAICANNREEMFVTVWVGILEISTGVLKAANAGHEYPALMRADGSFELLKDKHGLVVGGMSGARYNEYEIRMEPGAKLFLYTDGIPEATDKSGTMFGTKRMLETLNERKTDSPEGVLLHMKEAVNGFADGAEQFDDLTMLCLEYKEKNHET